MVSFQIALTQVLLTLFYTKLKLKTHQKSIACK